MNMEHDVSSCLALSAPIQHPLNYLLLRVLKLTLRMVHLRLAMTNRPSGERRDAQQLIVLVQLQQEEGEEGQEEEGQEEGQGPHKPSPPPPSDIFKIMKFD